MNQSAAAEIEFDSSPMEPWEILQEIVLALVDFPEEVRVSQRALPDGGVFFTIHVAREDVGKVVGRGGETVSILRRLFGRISGSKGQYCNIEVDEPDKAYRRPTVYRARPSAA